KLVEEGAPVVRTLVDRVPQLRCLATSRRRLDLEGEREFPVLPLPVPGEDCRMKIGESSSSSCWVVAGSRTRTRKMDANPSTLMQNESAQLFVDRAQVARPDFQLTPGNAAAVAELCVRLEGIPLAIELAAARAQVLTPAQMAKQLEHRFAFLVSRRRDVDERHRTLWAAIDWR